MELPVARTMPESLSLPFVAASVISNVSRVHPIVDYGTKKTNAAKLRSLAPASELVEVVAERSGMPLERCFVLHGGYFPALYLDLAGFHVVKSNVSSASVMCEMKYTVFGLSSATCVSSESIEKFGT